MWLFRHFFKPGQLFKYQPVSAEEFWKQAYPTEEPEPTYEDLEPQFVGYADLINQLVKWFGSIDLGKVFVGDEFKIAYTLWDYETALERYLVWNAKLGKHQKIWELEYDYPDVDCEDFAWYAKDAVSQPYLLTTPAFGLIWLIHPTLNLAHAMNFALASTKEGVKPYLYEPQLNSWYSSTEVKWRFWMLYM